MVNLDYLTGRLKELDIQTFLETSGAYEMSGTWDWVCLSPKKNSPPLASAFEYANELKVIVTGRDDFEWAIENAGFTKSDCILYLQPEWSVHKEILPDIIEFVKENPKWNISLQAHKYMRIP